MTAAPRVTCSLGQLMALHVVGMSTLVKLSSQSRAMNSQVTSPSIFMLLLLAERDVCALVTSLALTDGFIYTGSSDATVRKFAFETVL